jgi:hypothetical protein
MFSGWRSTEAKAFLKRLSARVGMALAGNAASGGSGVWHLIKKEKGVDLRHLPPGNPDSGDKLWRGAHSWLSWRACLF